MIRVAINGFGRIGRLFFRQAFDRPELEIVAINDLGDVENLAYLLEYDSVYRRYHKGEEIGVKKEGDANYITIGDRKVHVLNEKDPTHLPWKDLNVDVVVESTGVFESFEKAAVHLTAGAKRVVLSAPAKDADGTIGQTILLGINEKNFGMAKVTSNASCTTNSASPVIEILHEKIGIKKAMLSTVHAYTATQSVVDGPTKGSDYRRGRTAAQNISPSTTGAAIAVTRAVPDLTGKFDGLAFRVPVPAGSMSDITFLASRPTTIEEVNAVLEAAAKEPRWKGILKVTHDQLVSSDVIGESFGAVVDLSLTKVVDGDMVKVLSWYDNEWGYTSVLVEHVIKAGMTN